MVSPKTPKTQYVEQEGGVGYLYSMDRPHLPVRAKAKVSAIVGSRSFPKTIGKIQKIEYGKRYYSNSEKLRKISKIERCVADLEHARDAFIIYADLSSKWTREKLPFPTPGDNALERSVSILDQEFITMRCVFDSACIAFIRAFDATRAGSPLKKRVVTNGMPPLLLETYNLIEKYRNENSGHPGAAFAGCEATFGIFNPEDLHVVFNSFHSPGIGGKIFVNQARELINWLFQHKICVAYRDALKVCIEEISKSLAVDSDGNHGIDNGNFKIVPSEEYSELKFRGKFEVGLEPAVRFENNSVIIQASSPNLKNFRELFGIDSIEEVQKN